MAKTKKQLHFVYWVYKQTCKSALFQHPRFCN